VASADAVSQMFSQPYQGTWTFASCGVAAGSTYCTWNGAGTATIVIAVRNTTGGLPLQVTNVQRN